MQGLNQFGLKKCAFVVMALYAVTAHAALFDDKEARKKILEVEAKSNSNDDVHQAAINDLKKRLIALEAVLQSGGLVDMQNQIEALKQEVAQLKGDLEVANHALEQSQQRQKELYTDTDTRLRKIESAPAPTPVTAAPPPPAVDEKETKAFAEAEAIAKTAKHKEAFAAFDQFLRDFPNSKMVPDALYGMGYSQFALKNYKSSIATQQKLLDGHPESPKVPDAMYNMANSQIQLNQFTNAKATLRALVAKYPDAAVTPNAQKRLKTLESIK
jgi:tol-pal system protein YbgF